MDKEELERAVANCDRDPIHIPGAIQDFGYLIATDRRFTTLEFASVNVSEIAARPAMELLGEGVEALFTLDEIHAIRNTLGHETIAAQRERVGAKHVDGAELQITAHAQGDRALIEFVPEQQESSIRFAVIEKAREFVTHRSGLEDIDELLWHSVGRLRAMIGYDRVKAYRFLPDGAGVVVAEAKRPDVASYLGLRFPPTDIPPIARRLYAQTPIRVIHDVDRADLGVLARDPGAAPLDMSLAVLRGLDKVHGQYLKNMGVRATLTIPIVVDGALWGLFAAHHFTPKRPDPSMLVAAELSGKLLSLRIQHVLAMRRHEQLRSATALANKLIVADDSLLSARENWSRHQSAVAQMVPCNGLLVRMSGDIEAYGAHPSPAACAALFALADPTAGALTAINDLPARLPGVDWGETAGALMLSPSRAPRIELAFLRNLAVQETTRAGAPDKDVVQSDDGPRLNPRNSFETYRETARDRCEEWSAQDLEFADALRSALAQALETQIELREERHRLGLLVRELNHRVRNILALVQSLSVQSREASTSVEAYATALEERIAALAGAHNLLTRSEMRGARMRDLVELELSPYGGSGGRVAVDGPEVVLRPDAAQVIALLLHEITSNAVKYGALSADVGRVVVAWRIEQEGLAVSWREEGGPEVASPLHSGFGRSIIENVVPYELGGRSTLRFEQSGVAADFWLPGELLSDVEPPEMPSLWAPRATDAAIEAPRPSNDAGNGASQRRALIVEDNFVIAMQSRRMLMQEHFGEVDTASTTAEALAALSARAYDFCLLDVNLHGEMSTPVARELNRRNVPFFFATAYGSDGADIVEAFSAPVISKPIIRTALMAALNALFPKQ